MKFYKKEIMERIQMLRLPFNEYGHDPYGVSQKHLASFFTMLSWMYHKYLDVSVYGIENVPQDGRVMLVGNHSGGVALDGGMIIASLMFEMEQPRLAHGMAEKFLNAMPFSSTWLNRVGQFTGLPQHAIRLLEDDRALMVFPEGARGTAKLYKERYALVRFGTGFMRLALQTNSPIVPIAFIGGGDAIPTIANLYSLGKLVGAPYVPVTPYIFPIPRPVPCQIYYGEPIHFEGTGNEDDDTIEYFIDKVKLRIAELIQKGWAKRGEGIPPGLETYLNSPKLQKPEPTQVESHEELNAHATNKQDSSDAQLASTDSTPAEERAQ